MNRLHVELRSADLTGDTLTGLAAVYDQPAVIGRGGLTEDIAPGAFTAALSRPDLDVVARVNHDPSQLLGRTRSGTLRLTDTPDGLAFEVDLPDTTTGRDLRALVQRGDITGASFAFRPGREEWSRGGRHRRHIEVAALVDVAPVTDPAYPAAGRLALRTRPLSTDQIIRARHRAATQRKAR